MRVKKSMTAMVHGYHVRTDKENAVLVKEKICEQLEDGSYRYIDNLKTYYNPVRPYWITKPEWRNHQYKKEFEYVDRLERYNVPDSLLLSSVKNNLQSTKKYYRDVLNDPYIYGADIDAAVLLKHKYMSGMDPDIPVKYTVGALDIENEIYGDERILAITYIHEKEIYTVALRDYMLIKDPNNPGNTEIATEQHIYEKAEELIGPLLTQHNFTLIVNIEDNEVDMIKWIFSHIHRCKTDFIGIWNMRHDIPHILKRLEALNADIPNIICHPTVPKELRAYNYALDNNKSLSHFTDKWDWFDCAGYSQFVDAMCLYSRLRKTSGRKSSYALGNVTSEELGHGKLELNELGDHTHEQKNNFVPYVVYNINDVLIMQMMEFKNRDYTKLMSLCGVSMLKDFSKQIAMGKNNTFFYAYEQGKIICATGSQMATKYDEMMPKSGGAVLNPNRTFNIGVAAIQEAPSIETKMCVCVNDLDVAAEYPSIISAFNISKETKKDTVIGIEGYPTTSIEQFFANIVSPVENAVWMAEYFFGLPDYVELETMVDKYISTRLKKRLPSRLDPENNSDDKQTVDRLIAAL